jgi:hypothetical protein
MKEVILTRSRFHIAIFNIPWLNHLPPSAVVDDDTLLPQDPDTKKKKKHSSLSAPVVIGNKKFNIHTPIIPNQEKDDEDDEEDDDEEDDDDDKSDKPLEPFAGNLTLIVRRAQLRIENLADVPRSYPVWQHLLPLFHFVCMFVSVLNFLSLLSNVSCRTLRLNFFLHSINIRCHRHSHMVSVGA